MEILPTHKHKQTGSVVFPDGYDKADLELLPKDFWELEAKQRKLADIRQERDNRLAASDAYMLPDRGLSEVEFNAWTAYRAALRDITKSDLDNLTWPIVPQKELIK